MVHGKNIVITVKKPVSFNFTLFDWVPNTIYDFLYTQWNFEELSSKRGKKSFRFFFSFLISLSQFRTAKKIRDLSDIWWLPSCWSSSSLKKHLQISYRMFHTKIGMELWNMTKFIYTYHFLGSFLTIIRYHHLL